MQFKGSRYSLYTLYSYKKVGKLFLTYETACRLSVILSILQCTQIKVKIIHCIIIGNILCYQTHSIKISR